jgi:hypothetical protein
VGDLLVALGASVARVRLKDAERIAVGAAKTGVPFTALLTDRATVEAGAGRLLPILGHERNASRPARAVVIIDPAERSEIARFRAQGFNGYLVRPVRPLSLLTQLFGEAEEEQAKALEAALPRRPLLRAQPADGKGTSILLDEELSWRAPCWRNRAPAWSG